MSILYIGVVSDPTQFGPYLRQAIVDQLVAQMAYKFTGSIDVAQKSQQYAENHLKEMLVLDNLQSANDLLPSDTFIDIRLTSGNDIGDTSGSNT